MRQHARVVLVHERDGVEELALASEEASRRGRAGRRSRGVRSGGNSPSPSCEEPGRAVEVLEPVQAEVAQLVPVEQSCGRGREDDLAAVRERGDARSTVDVDADVALAGERRCARVQPHAHRDRPGASAVCASSAACAAPPAVGKATKNASPCVSTSTPPCAANASRSDAPVLGERVGVRIGAERVQQARRALDVREEEGDGAGGQVPRAWRVNAGSYAASHQLVQRMSSRVEHVLGLLGAGDRELGRIEQPDLHEERRLIPVDVLVRDLAVLEPDDDAEREPHVPPGRRDARAGAEASRCRA